MDDLSALIAEHRARYGHVYAAEFEDVTFIWRPLTTFEYRSIFNSPAPDWYKEEVVCYTCVFHPPGFDFSGSLAGYATVLAHQILEASHYKDPNETLKLLDAFRREMDDFDCQMDCIIAEAFPQIPVDAIQHMTMEKRLWLLSRAEWTLANLRGVRLTVAREPRGQKPHEGAAPSAQFEGLEKIERGPDYRGADPDWIYDESLELLDEENSTAAKEP